MTANVDAATFTRYRHLSVAMTGALDDQLATHFDKGPRQEDLTFALWRPSVGHSRYTAVLRDVVLPAKGDRDLHENVSFHAQYVQRVLQMVQPGDGIALIHSHLGPGWQDMSDDDVIAERERLAAAVAGRTGLPLVGLTWATDRCWSARFWLREGRNVYERYGAATVRVAGHRLRISFNPWLMPVPSAAESQVATVSVWGEQHQADLARLHVGIVGLGSVGSIVAETLSRVGFTRITLIDHDRIEHRNLDRTLGAMAQDALEHRAKVAVAGRVIHASHTAPAIEVEAFPDSLLTSEGLERALDCDVLFSCVDRPWPRHVLNALAYGHLIPVIDGGILAKVEHGRLIHADWRIHTVGPGRTCLRCLGALRREDISLDMAGKLDDPEYIKGLGPSFSPLLARQNVFPFSLSVAAHEVLQMIGLVTGLERIGGIGSQMYHCFPGQMEVTSTGQCEANCEYDALTATAVDLSGNITS